MKKIKKELTNETIRITIRIVATRKQFILKSASLRGKPDFERWRR